MDENEVEQIEKLGTVREEGRHGSVQCLTVIGQIEGHVLLPETAKTTKYEHVMPLLAAVEQSEEADALLILLNTVGGDIEAGMGIAELIAGMSKPTASLVLGGGHSIGVPLAVAADRSFIAPSAAMTLHPVRMSGTVIGAPQTFSYLEKIQERIVHFITSNSRIERGTLMSLMLKTGELAGDVGSVIYGEDAVRLGLVDEVGGLSDALGYLYGEIRRNKAQV